MKNKYRHRLWTKFKTQTIFGYKNTFCEFLRGQIMEKVSLNGKGVTAV